MSSHERTPWPVLRHYDQDHLARIALPLGGIGTGTVSLGGRGDLRDWEIVNRPAKGWGPRRTFFALWARRADGEPVARALEGPLPDTVFEGAAGSVAPNHGLPRFRSASFDAAYPLGQVNLHDPDVPLLVRIEAFNPLIPADADRSGIPVAVLRFVLHNPTDMPIAAAVCANLENFIGTDGLRGTAVGNRNTMRESDGVRGIFLHSLGVDPRAEQWGTMALVTTSPDVSYRTSWLDLTWNGALLDWWDDWTSDGALDERTGASDMPVASLAAHGTVAPGATVEHTFMLAWHFPNRQSWTPDGKGVWKENGACDDGPPTIGNYYTTHYSDAWDAATRTVRELADLERLTVRFVRAFCDSDLPRTVKEAALFNLSTLRTQTCFRTPDGYFWGWEGTFDQHGSCYGSCTHVWNYEQATAFLFGDLACRMREVEFLHATRPDGHMSFRVHLPLRHATAWGIAAADGQMGTLMKLYRDWQLAGDDTMLARLWPRARNALEWCWVEGGWDADRDGVMEGCQHNTMDVEYYGPNPQMGFWYLGALRAAEAMARHLGEHDFAATCRELFERGKHAVKTTLFNGEYYEHIVQPPGDTPIAPGLRHATMGAQDLSDPDLQLGAGCLVDQLVGQYMAHICGLGYLADPDQIKTALTSIMRYNFRTSLWGHFNHMRSYALADEAALLMASYPHGNRPTRPFPYFNEVMTGFEYTAAVHMLYEGQPDGLRVIEAIRARYDGRRRNPFDEAECGHHYARAMASWAAVLALTGFRWSGVEGALSFAASAVPSTYFWSTGYAWGTLAQTPSGPHTDVTLTVLHGTLSLRSFHLAGVGSIHFDQPRQCTVDALVDIRVPKGS
jgi:non-lysosomal glucosylceramidase